MPRQRDESNEWLPDGVYFLKSRGYYIFEYPKRHKLIDGNATRAEVWAAYDREVNSGSTNPTVNALIDAYLASPAYTSEIRSSTQSDYLRYANKIRPVFGNMVINNVTPVHVQQFVDKVGATHPTAAGHYKAFLSRIYNWGIGRGYVKIANPTTGVEKPKTRAERQGGGGRYVEHIEYVEFYNFLRARGHHAHAAAMAIAYRCAARNQDILRLRKTKPANPLSTDGYIMEEGIFMHQKKTGKRQVKLWSPELLAEVNAVLDIEYKRPSEFVIRTSTGTPYTRGGFHSIWKREQIAALEQGVIGARFRFHDMKVKGISDYQGDDMLRFSGHKTTSQAQRYNRTADRVPTISNKL